MDSVLELDRCAGASERYPQNVNPQWVRLLDLLRMNVRYERCRGTELFVTFSENSLAMRAALATPGSFGEGRTGPGSIEAGKYLQARLAEALGDFAVVNEVRRSGVVDGN
jgi:hypothetical protein